MVASYWVIHMKRKAPISLYASLCERNQAPTTVCPRKEAPSKHRHGARDQGKFASI